MRKQRVTEIHFYEWSVSRWRASEARASLSLAAREIYRECLDLCYTTGSFPRDPVILAGLCACSPSEIEEAMPQIERYFYPLRTDKNRLANTFADLFRRSFYRFKKDQKAKGKLGGRPKAKEDNDMKTPGFQDEKPKEAKLSEAKLSKAKLSSGSKEAKPPQSRRRTPNEIDKMGSLLWGASEGSPVAAGPPDKHLAESVLNAIGDLETAEKWLAEKMAQGKRPKTSYQYWVTLACAEFIDGRRP